MTGWQKARPDPKPKAHTHTEANMSDRTLTITLQSDWQGALRAAGRRANATRYQGEVLNFETPTAFFGQLTARRWALVNALQGQGELAVRELSRRVGRDVKRVHEDVLALAELGLVERSANGGVVCPFAAVHIDMQMRAAA